MSDNNRPEWARGDEWEGWQKSRFGDPAIERRIRKEAPGTSGDTLTLAIKSSGFLQIGLGNYWLPCISPAHALVAANALADACGGWA